MRLSQVLNVVAQARPNAQLIGSYKDLIAAVEGA